MRARTTTDDDGPIGTPTRRGRSRSQSDPRVKEGSLVDRRRVGWAADGTRFVFMSRRSGSCRLYRSELSGQEVSPLELPEHAGK